MRGRRLVLAALVVSMLLVSCNQKQPSAMAAGRAASPVAAAQTADGPASRAAVTDVFETTGPIVVENQVDVLAQREGVLTSILVDTGTRVEKGQVLAALDDRQLAADREAAEAKVQGIEAESKNWEAEAKVLESDYSRDQEMYKANLITEKQLDHSRYKMIGSGYEKEHQKQNLRNAEANLRSLNVEIEKTKIVAPFSGVVARRYVRAGQKVAVNDRLFWISATSPLIVKFTLPEYFLGHLQRNQELSIHSPFAPELEHKAKITLISPVVDPASGTIDVQAELIGSAGEFHPGMTAKIQLKKPQ